MLKNKKDLIENIRLYVEKNVSDTSKWKGKLEKDFEESLLQKTDEYLEDIFEKSLDYFDAEGKDKEKKIEGLEEHAVIVIKFFFNKYHNILRQAIYSSPYIASAIEALSVEDRKVAWKGIIIGKFLSGLKIKSYVQEKLREMLLD